MEKQGVPLQQYPQQTPTPTGQPPVYAQDPNASAYQQQAAQHQQQQQPGMYQQQQQPSPYGQAPPPQGYVSPQPMSPQPTAQQQPPQPQQGQQGYMSPQPGAGAPVAAPQGGQSAQFQSATPIASLGRGPAPADCPACGQRAMTNVAFEVGNSTHAWALGLCCFTWCLCWIPYLMNSLKDVQHKCGKCGVLLATWHRSGTTEVHIHG